MNSSILEPRHPNEIGCARDESEWIRPAILTSILRATKNQGRASKNHLMESAGIPFPLFESYFRYALSNGFVNLNDTPSENLYYITPKGLEVLDELAGRPLDVHSSNHFELF